MIKNLNRAPLWIILFVLFISCINDPSEDAVFLRIENQTGYNYESLGVYLFSGDYSTIIPFKNIKNREYSEYIEISKDSLRKDGLYSTYVIAFTPNLTLVYQTRLLSFDFEPDRLEPFLNGKFTFTLALERGEYLSHRWITESDESIDSTLVRIKNVGNKNFNEVLMTFPKGDSYETVSFGRLNGGESSEYHFSEYSYRGAPVKVYTSTDSLQIVPVDFIEGILLPKGKFTLELDAKFDERDVSKIMKD